MYNKYKDRFHNFMIIVLKQVYVSVIQNSIKSN